MLLFLTYHRVLAKPHSKPEFYDISLATLERHLEMLAQKGFQCLPPEELLATKPPAERSFVLSFDDGTRDHFDAVLPLLERSNYRALFFVPTSKLNRPEYLTEADARELHRRGQYIGLHSHEHKRMDQMDDSTICEQMRLSQEQVQKLTGSKSAIFAPPGGFINARVRSIALDCGVRAIRTMRWGYNRNLDLTNLHCVPINSRTTEKHFHRIMESRSMNMIYSLKEAAKRLLPGRFYQRIRDKLYADVN